MNTKQHLEKGIDNLIDALRNAVEIDNTESRIMLTILAVEFFKLIINQALPKEEDRDIIIWITNSGARSACVDENVDDRLLCVEMLKITLYKLLLNKEPEDTEKEPENSEVEIKSLLN